MKTYATEASKKYNSRLKKVLPGGVHYNMKTPWQENPLHFTLGKNSRLWDLDGNEYLDLLAKFGSMLLGHSNARFNDYLKKRMDRVLCVNHSDIDMEVCERIIEHFPSMEMVRFGLSGTEMVQNAIRLARAYTGKKKFIRFEGHFHGSSDNIVGGRVTDPAYPVPRDVDPKDLLGTDGRAPGVLENESFLIPWNDSAILQKVLGDHSDEIAAVIMEPYCINGGGIMPRDGYAVSVRKLCDQYNTVLIFDEIITGMRVGLGGAQKRIGVKPDLTTLGKSITGCGIPVSVLGGKRDIMELYEKKRVLHAGTYNGYALGMEAIKATFDIVADATADVYGRMREQAKKLYTVFTGCAESVGLPLVVQGPETCATYHSCENIITENNQLNEEILLRDIVINHSLAAHGIITANVSRMYPNITLDEQDLEFFEDRIENALVHAKSNIGLMADIV